jgi:hypothetical protein
MAEPSRDDRNSDCPIVHCTSSLRLAGRGLKIQFWRWMDRYFTTDEPLSVHTERALAARRIIA